MTRGFTLAEVLITLGIIGIVASVTIPALIINYQNRVFETGKTVFEHRMGEAMRQMNVNDELTGYTQTKDFVTALQKYMKIIKVCEADKLTSCFPDKINVSDGEPIDVAAADFVGAAEGWNTGLMGIVLQNGHSAVIKYNPNCQSSGIAATIQELDYCAAITYDTNGKSMPNALNKDVQGAALSSGEIPILKMPSFTITETDISYEPLNTCDESSPYHNPHNASFCKNDRWAGAKKVCDDLDMELPSTEIIIGTQYCTDPERNSQACEFYNWCQKNSCSESYWLAQISPMNGYNAYALYVESAIITANIRTNSLHKVRCIK